MLDHAHALLPLLARDLVVAVSARESFASTLDAFARRRVALTVAIAPIIAARIVSDRPIERASVGRGQEKTYVLCAADSRRSSHSATDTQLALSGIPRCSVAADLTEDGALRDARVRGR